MNDKPLHSPVECFSVLMQGKQLLDDGAFHDCLNIISPLADQIRTAGDTTNIALFESLVERAKFNLQFEVELNRILQSLDTTDEFEALDNLQVLNKIHLSKQKVIHRKMVDVLNNTFEPFGEIC